MDEHLIIVILITGIPFLLVAFSLGLNNKLQIEKNKLDIKGENLANLIEQKIKITNNFIFKNKDILPSITTTTISNLLESLSVKDISSVINTNDNLTIILEEIKKTIDNNNNDYLNYLEELESLDSSLDYSATIYNEIIIKYNNFSLKSPKVLLQLFTIMF